MTELPNQEILTGNISLLKQQIVERIQARATQPSLEVWDFSEYGLSPQMEHSKYINVKFEFEGKTETGKKANRDRKLKLVKLNHKTVTLEVIQAYAKRIIQVFGGLWEINLGKEGYRYAELNKGLNIKNMFCKTEVDARHWVESLLDINGFAPDWKCLKREGSVLPEVAYSENPGKTTIANQQVEEAQKRPYGRVQFVRAKIWFPESTKIATLCKRNGYVIPSLDFLTKPSGTPPADTQTRTSSTNTASGSPLS